MTLTAFMLATCLLFLYMHRVCLLPTHTYVTVGHSKLITEDIETFIRALLPFAAPLVA
jgi:hypothetical protein